MTTETADPAAALTDELTAALAGTDPGAAVDMLRSMLKIPPRPARRARWPAIWPTSCGDSDSPPASTTRAT